jgi:hypothetical protein
MGYLMCMSEYGSMLFHYISIQSDLHPHSLVLSALSCRALTCDSEGSFRLWAIEKSVGSRAVCLGLFDAHTTLSTLKVYLYTHMYMKRYHIDTYRMMSLESAI